MLKCVSSLLVLRRTASRPIQVEAVLEDFEKRVADEDRDVVRLLPSSHRVWSLLKHC